MRTTPFIAATYGPSAPKSVVIVRIGGFMARLPGAAGHQAVDDSNRAVILEEIPPLGVNWPTTVIRRGRQAATRSSRITLIECS